jgi:hypothetical protein
MSTTNTDAVSIIVTLLGCGLAIYGVLIEGNDLEASPSLCGAVPPFRQSN